MDIEKQYLNERYGKWATTLSFGLENVPEWGPDVVYKREHPDRHTRIVWVTEFRVEGEGNGRYLSLKFTYTYPEDEIESIDFQFAAGLVNQKDPMSSRDGIRRTMRNCESFMIQWRLESILDPENHYYLDRTVNVDVDFCIYSILYSDGLSRFHFQGKPLNWMKGTYIGLHNKEISDVHFTIHYEISTFHSRFFAAFPTGFNCFDIHDHMDLVDPLERCLQIMHGVRLHIQPDEAKKMLDVAHLFHMRNVIRYIETYWILEDLQHDYRITYRSMCFLNLRRLMMTRFRSWNFKTFADFKTVLSATDLDNKKVSTGELMKTWIAVFMRLPNQ